jgi:hypothetical protein
VIVISENITMDRQPPNGYQTKTADYNLFSLRL